MHSKSMARPTDLYHVSSVCLQLGGTGKHSEAMAQPTDVHQPGLAGLQQPAEYMAGAAGD